MKEPKLKYQSVSATKRYLAHIVDEKKTYVFSVEVFQVLGKHNIDKTVSLRRVKYHAADCQEKIRPRSRENRIRTELITYFERK